MIVTREPSAPSWGWGSPWQLVACRVSQVLGLVAALWMLAVLLFS